MEHQDPARNKHYQLFDNKEDIKISNGHSIACSQNKGSLLPLNYREFDYLENIGPHNIMELQFKVERHTISHDL